MTNFENSAYFLLLFPKWAADDGEEDDISSHYNRIFFLNVLTYINKWVILAILT